MSDATLLEPIISGLWELLKSPQFQSALIAGMVALVVARHGTRRGKAERKADRAERLLNDVYGPLDTSLSSLSLYDCVTRHSDQLKKNRLSYTEEIRRLIDQALDKHYRRLHWFGKDEKEDAKEGESSRAIRELETQLRPLLSAEIHHLQDVIRKG